MRVRVEGPVFELGPRIDAALEEAAERLADDASERWHAFLNASLRTQTPYYVPNLTRERRGPLVEAVHDRGVVYGPWLEGVGSRNKTSRFKGYWAARRAGQAVEATVPVVVGEILDRALGGA